MIEEKLKKVSNLSYQHTQSKNEEEKELLDKELKELLLELKQNAIETFKEESDVKKFLDNIIHFYKYSYNNQCLIYLQKPDAQYIASLKAFNKMGYNVNKGEKGIKILIPSIYKLVKVNNNITSLNMLTNAEKQKYYDKNDSTVEHYRDVVGSFRIGNVFDASQTTMPLENIEKSLNPILEDDNAIGIEDLFIKAIYRDNFKVEYVDKIDSGAKGYCDIDNNRIVVVKGLGNLMRLKVVIHEYAHGLAHQHLKDNKLDYKQNQNKYETEAESIAYVVSKYLGLDTSMYSTTYLYSWSKEKDFKEIDDSLNTIVNYSKKIIKNYEKILEKENKLNMEVNV